MAKGDGKTPRKPINTGDTPTVKALLDEVAIEAILSQGYSEDFFVQNVKILIGLLTCSCAVVAQFYPKKFPDNKLVLTACIVSYMALSALFQWFTSSVEQDVVLFTKKPKSSSGEKPQITLSTQMPRYQDKYKMSISAVTATSEYPSFECEESIAKYVLLMMDVFSELLPKGSLLALVSLACRWFDKKGNFAEDVFRRFALDCLEKFGAGSKKKDQ